jgi:hypothetical protein
MRSLVLRPAIVWAIFLAGAVAGAQPVTPRPETASADIASLLVRLEELVRTGNAGAFDELLTTSANRVRASSFAAVELRAGSTRAVIKERDRQTRPDGSVQLLTDVFVEYGDRARVTSWRLDLRQVGASWRIENQERLSTVENLYRLSVNRARQFTARDFAVRAEDLELTLTAGSVFTIDSEEGPTGLVLLGRGEMRFSPTPATEKGQVRIFTGSENLETRFDAAYIRFNRFDAHADRSQLVERPIDPRELKRAELLFQEESPKTYLLEMDDLSPDAWFLLPSEGDFVAEVRTRRFERLTYARASSEPEDISLFDRRRQRHIAVYPSAEKLATRGRFYDEDDFVPYDVLDYDIDLTFTPDRLWLEGRARMRMRVRANSIAQVSLRLAETLTVRSIVSSEFGRLFSLRVKGQNNVLVSLPATLIQGAMLTLEVAYGGPLLPLSANREALAPQPPGQQPQRGNPIPPREAFETSLPAGEPNYLYSNNTYWYPQSPVSDYVTATLRFSVPASMTCVASGMLGPDSPSIESGDARGRRKRFIFRATKPVRYLAFLVSRMTRVDQAIVKLDEESDPTDGTIDLSIEANPMQVREGRPTFNRAVDILRFYRSLVGRLPYQGMTLALVENLVPGGHSPAYFAALHHPLPNTPLVWRGDPASFGDYPEYFLAHELAHQWWGQGVGWRNYHEQWLSEGFAQYFAALYAGHARGERALGAYLRQLRRWSLEESDEGPIYLGYRLGHVKRNGRIFRALVYNKGAAVLHMLRRFVGDDAFWRGLKRFYATSQYRKVGTEELRAAVEAESGLNLERFFERWVYGDTLPQLTLTYSVESSDARRQLVLRVEQAGDLFDVPLVVTLEYADGRAVDVLVPVTERSTAVRVPLDGELRRVEVDDDRGVLARVRMPS